MHSLGELPKQILFLNVFTVLGGFSEALLSAVFETENCQMEKPLSVQNKVAENTGNSEPSGRLTSGAELSEVIALAGKSKGNTELSISARRAVKTYLYGQHQALLELLTAPKRKGPRLSNFSQAQEPEG